LAKRAVEAINNLKRRYIMTRRGVTCVCVIGAILLFCLTPVRAQTQKGCEDGQHRHASERVIAQLYRRRIRKGDHVAHADEGL